MKRNPKFRVGELITFQGLAHNAIAEIKRTCSCDYRGLRIAAYDSEYDRQDPKGHWTHPSALALRR